MTEQAFDSLNGPVQRVTAPHAPVPFTPSLEEVYAPTVASIVDAVDARSAENARWAWKDDDD